MTTTRTISRDRHAWLQTELDEWTSDGLLSPLNADAIRSRYEPAQRAGAGHVLAKVMLWIGGAFLGVGLIWLVAANLEDLSPVVRFAGVTVLWLAFLLAPEALAARGHSRALVGALRLVGALAFGAVIFQASQSLQVPAYEPKLLGLWALGAFAHAYVVKGVSPLAVALATGSVWWFWQPLAQDANGVRWTMLIALGAVVAFGMAAVHDSRLDTFARLWRITATAYTLVALFVAALPWIEFDASFTTWFLVVAALAALAAVAGLVAGSRLARLEVVGALALTVLAFGLLAWEVPTDVPAGGDQWLHSVCSVLVYVLAAVALTALGALREDPWISALAMAGLVVFVTFQSFAVFGQIITGAWLFLVLGTVLLGTGYLFDRARRSITATLREDRPDFLEGT
ncbi:MAG: DUF2157 domain-containing protein [Nocardioides sp.]|uniref:DUF2157 domain-containing protein n=1 Tax=Nocardioides sp. TaxID=35761 RepID=UPI003EFE62C3